MQMQMHSTCSVSASLHNLRRGKKKKMKSEAAESHKLCKENLGEA